MIVLSMALVLAGLVMLLLGVAGVGQEPLRFVYASIGACLLAAVFLVAGILRARPSRRPAPAGDVARPTWSGAVPPPATPAADQGVPAPEAHVQVLSAQEAAREAVAATSTTPLDLGGHPAPAAGDAGLEPVVAEAAGDAEHERFVRALDGLDLDTVRLERLRGRFSTLERLRAAPVAELVDVPGISEELAAAIHARVRAAG